jgi:hypothetical protein
MTKRKAATTIKPKRGSATKRRRDNRTSKGASATKTQACLDLLSRPSGATLEEMQEATGWQQHSVRGLLAGKIKKMPGVTLNVEKPAEGPRRYRVAVG